MQGLADKMGCTKQAINVFECKAGALREQTKIKLSDAMGIHKDVFDMIAIRHNSASSMRSSIPEVNDIVLALEGIEDAHDKLVCAIVAMHNCND